MDRVLSRPGPLARGPGAARRARAAAPWCRAARSPERLILELAGLLLGALDRVWAVADQATVFLCTALAVIEVSLGRVQEARGLSTATRAHLLADLAIISQAIESALGAA